MTSTSMVTQEKRILDFLSKIELFKNLPEEDLSALVSYATIKTYPRGAIIYNSEKGAEKVNFVVQGLVKTGTMSNDGREMIKHVMQPFDMFGELALSGVAPTNDFAAVLKEPVEVLRIPIDVMRTMMAKHPEMTLTLLAGLATRLKRSERRLEEMVHSDARGRIVAYIKEQAERNGVMFGNETLVRHGLTHQELSNVTGTSRQLVTIVLNALRKENLINFDRSTVLVRNLKSLA